MKSLHSLGRITVAAGAAHLLCAAALAQDSSGAKEPVSTTVRDDGLVIEDISIGEGELCEPGSAVTVNCVGQLEDGTVFWQTEEGEPFTFSLQRVIPGWKEGLPGMRVGGTRQLTIPPEMAYGKRGAPPTIPPNSTLTFLIELINVVEVEYDDVVVGEGKPCPPDAIIKINYEGRLAEDGTVFDTTKGGGPATFVLSQLIDGWKIGIPGMRRGGKRTMQVPHELGYGDRGSPPNIPPQADLIFDVELIDFIYPDYEDIEVGSGSACSPTSSVRLSYTGKLPDGTVFVTTKDDGPVDVELQQLLVGLQIGLQGMQPGGKRVITIPPEWAYSPDSGAQANIPPRTKLIYEVELHEVR